MDFRSGAAILFEPAFDDAAHLRAVRRSLLPPTNAVESIAERKLRRHRGTSNLLLLLANYGLTKRRFRTMNSDQMKGN
jgi:hypothetical protein